jgi:hypothetical protein
MARSSGKESIGWSLERFLARKKRPSVDRTAATWYCGAIAK